MRMQNFRTNRRELPILNSVLGKPDENGAKETSGTARARESTTYKRPGSRFVLNLVPSVTLVHARCFGLVRPHPHPQNRILVRLKSFFFSKFTTSDAVFFMCNIAPHPIGLLPFLAIFGELLSSRMRVTQFKCQDCFILFSFVRICHGVWHSSECSMQSSFKKEPDSKVFPVKCI